MTRFHSIARRRMGKIDGTNVGRTQPASIADLGTRLRRGLPKPIYATGSYKIRKDKLTSGMDQP
jgi:hypothetical protein